jgi:hypothetical protein
MNKRQERLDRIVAVKREYLTALVAVDLLDERLRTDPSYLNAFDLRNRDARTVRENLEVTYLIRVYAEFESGLRDAWNNAFHRATHPPMRDLLIAIATRCPIPQEWLNNADEVRAYRNTLVHEGDVEAAYIPFEESQSRLSRFFSRLPFDW